MAQVTITRSRTGVEGDRRMRFLQVNIANTGDQLTAAQILPSIRYLDQVISDGATSTAVNAAFTPGTSGPVTFNYSGGGAQSAVDVILIGR